MSIVVHTSGKLFNAQWKPILDTAIHGVLAAVGDYTEAAVVMNLDDVIVENSGNYISTIHSEWQAEDLAITDGTVYGPWLEGLSSRNSSSRFKGYWTFRNTTQQLNNSTILAKVAHQILDPAVESINI